MRAVSLGAAVLVAAVLGGTAPARAVEDASDPACGTMPVQVSGPMVPGAALSIVVECPAMQPERYYTASITSVGVPMAGARPFEPGAVVFPEVHLPLDFTVPGHHSLELYDAVTGEHVGSTELLVDEAGGFMVVTGGPGEPATTLRDRVRDTGLVTSRAEAALKAAALALALVAFALRTRRRRRSPTGRRDAAPGVPTGV